MEYLHHLKKTGCLLLNKNHKRLNSNLNNIDNDNKMITDVPLNYKQAISCMDKNYWIEVMNAKLKNFYDNKIMVFKKKIPKRINPTTKKWTYALKRDGNGNIINIKEESQPKVSIKLNVLNTT